MPRLTITRPSGPPITYRLEGEAITIGRSVKTDLMLDDPTLSRLHVELRRGESGWVVLDRGSRNGTRLNDKPISEATRLRDGDRIGIGDTVIAFHAGLDSPEPKDLEEPATRTIQLGAGEDAIIGSSPLILELLDACDRVAPTPASVLITGESGTGKELIARRLHRRSARSGPLIVVNCPALPGALLESELFGIERGVATGVDARPGLFESAAGGTLLLDEVGDMELGAQAKLLRVLAEGKVTRIGGRKPIDIDVRVIAATNHDLEADVGAGRFRRDLYHRLEVVRLRAPALRERRGDIPLLAAFALSSWSGPNLSLAPEALETLSRYDFPGNVRELLHAVERGCLFAEDGVVRTQHLPEAIRGIVAAESDPVRQLYERLLAGEISFWDGVRDPFLARALSREHARELILHAHREAGGSYKRLAERFGLGGQEYKRLLNFLRNHNLGVEASSGSGEESA